MLLLKGRGVLGLIAKNLLIVWTDEAIFTDSRQTIKQILLSLRLRTAVEDSVLFHNWPLAQLKLRNKFPSHVICCCEPYRPSDELIVAISISSRELLIIISLKLWSRSGSSHGWTNHIPFIATNPEIKFIFNFQSALNEWLVSLSFTVCELYLQTVTSNFILFIKLLCYFH